MAGKKGTKGHSPLEDWQWAEAEADYRCGIGARAIAERYGVKPNTVVRHMLRRGIRKEEGPWDTTY